MKSPAAIRDTLAARFSAGREPIDPAAIAGFGTYRLIGPDGAIKQTGDFINLITDIGDQIYAEAGAGASPNLATGMRLGTGSTAPAKNGAGAAIVTYVSGSNKAIDGTYPQTSDLGAGAGHRITYRTTWNAGEATATGIAEAVITNETPLTDVAGTAANTISRALISPVVNKGAADTLEVTWHHDFLGA